MLSFSKEEILNLDVLAKRISITGGKDMIRHFDGRDLSEYITNMPMIQALIISVDSYIENQCKNNDRLFFFQLKKDNDNVYFQYVYSI